MPANHRASTTIDPAALRPRLERELQACRRRLHGLIAPLDADAMHRQHDPIMSPLVWDVGHVGNFEELWLLRELDGRGPHDARLDQVYNPFENPRWTRAGLDVLEQPEALAYLAGVRAEALELLRRADLDPDRPLLAGGYVYRMILQHEAQHQETMLQALDLRGTSPEGSRSNRGLPLRSMSPRAPLSNRGLPLRSMSPRAPYPPAAVRSTPVPRPVDDRERVTIGAGPFLMGTDDRAWAYDNERPRHLVALPAFAIDRFPVTARRYAEFVAAGGYRRPELWSGPGRAWLEETGHQAPQGWEPDGRGGWLVRRFGHLGALDPREPVQHVCWHEAQAFARWAGGRLPTEAEWEKAAAWDPATRSSRTWPWGEVPPTPTHANLDHAGRGPAPVGAYPAGASAYGVEQLIGDVYEWTGTAFRGYPGYATFPYPEYSEVFFGDDHQVLRGASWATARWVARATFRNWDYPQRRQVFAGFRLAWEAP